MIQPIAHGHCTASVEDHYHRLSRRSYPFDHFFLMTWQSQRGTIAELPFLDAGSHNNSISFGGYCDSFINIFFPLLFNAEIPYQTEPGIPDGFVIFNFQVVNLAGFKSVFSGQRLPAPLDPIIDQADIVYKHPISVVSVYSDTVLSCSGSLDFPGPANGEKVIAHLGRIRAKKCPLKADLIISTGKYRLTG